jgi:hypothetical protein
MERDSLRLESPALPASRVGLEYHQAKTITGGTVSITPVESHEKSAFLTLDESPAADTWQRRGSYHGAASQSVDRNVRGHHGPRDCDQVHPPPRAWVVRLRRKAACWQSGSEASVWVAAFIGDFAIGPPFASPNAIEARQSVGLLSAATQSDETA